MGVVAPRGKEKKYTRDKYFPRSFGAVFTISTHSNCGLTGSTYIHYELSLQWNLCRRFRFPVQCMWRGSITLDLCVGNLTNLQPEFDFHNKVAIRTRFSRIVWGRDFRKGELCEVRVPVMICCEGWTVMYLTDHPTWLVHEWLFLCQCIHPSTDLCVRVCGLWVSNGGREGLGAEEGVPHNILSQLRHKIFYHYKLFLKR